MEEITAVILDVTGKLDTTKIPYMVSGSIAANFYAEPRFTNDIDIVLQLRKDLKGEIVRLFAPEYYVNETEIDEAFSGVGMFNIISNAWLVKCDLILLNDSPFSLHAFERRKREQLQGYPISVISLEDLILQKLVWNKLNPSGMQLQDVRRLLVSNRDLIDRPYLDSWSRPLNVGRDLEDLWSAIQAG